MPKKTKDQIEKARKAREKRKVFFRRVLIKKGIDRQTIKAILINHEKMGLRGSIHDAIKQHTQAIKSDKEKKTKEKMLARQNGKNKNKNKIKLPR